MCAEWEEEGMIADSDGVLQVLINTSTVVPVQLYNNQGNTVTMAEAPQVLTTSYNMLSKLGGSTTGPTD